MGYYGRGRYRSWRSRGWSGSSRPTEYTQLQGTFGGAVGEIRHAFMHLDEEARDELFSDYGAIHGSSAERYARNTFPKWKSGLTGLSGQTMRRLVQLVPPYLSSEQRFSILQSVLKLHKKSALSQSIIIDVKAPSDGFSKLQDALAAMSREDVLAHLPEHVMEAASWLYDDDVTAARAMLAEAERLENDVIRAQASRDIELLKRTILTGQVQRANYSVEMPAGRLNVVAATPPTLSKCFVSSVCFGEDSPETLALRAWRDRYLIGKWWGRKFIIWYYKNGEHLAESISRSAMCKAVAKTFIKAIAMAVARNMNGSGK